MPNHRTSRLLTIAILLFSTASLVIAQPRGRGNSSATVPKDVLLRIIRAEDERRWDDGMRSLLAHNSSAVRIRTALAAGRIGNEAAVADLIHIAQERWNSGSKADGRVRTR